AIAWIYRDEYAKAGFKMLPVEDADGSRTARQALSHALGLLPVSLLPFLFRLAGPIYLIGALVLGVTFLVSAILFARVLTVTGALQLFFFSSVYLRRLLAMLVLVKVK